MFITYIHFLFLQEPRNQCFLLFFQILGLFALILTIIIFDVALHIIYIIHTEYFWLVMTDLKERFYT